MDAELRCEGDSMRIEMGTNLVSSIDEGVLMYDERGVEGNRHAL